MFGQLVQIPTNFVYSNLPTVSSKNIAGSVSQNIHKLIILILLMIKQHHINNLCIPVFTTMEFLCPTSIKSDLCYDKDCSLPWLFSPDAHIQSETQSNLGIWIGDKNGCISGHLSWTIQFSSKRLFLISLAVCTWHPAISYRQFFLGCLTA